MKKFVRIVKDGEDFWNVLESVTDSFLFPVCLATQGGAEEELKRYFIRMEGKTLKHGGSLETARALESEGLAPTIEMSWEEAMALDSESEFPLKLLTPDPKENVLKFKRL